MIILKIICTIFLHLHLNGIKKSINNWYILCEVLGSWFDECMNDIYRAREESHGLVTCVILCFQFMLQTVE